MNKLEIYGIGLVVLMLAFAGAYFKGRSAGYEAAELKAAAELTKANARTEKLQDDLIQATRDDATKLETTRTQHEAQLNAARSSISDRLCRPVNPAKMPEGSAATAGTPAATTGDAVPQPTHGTDEWRYAFVKACLNDSDALAGWQSWWSLQQAALR